MATYDIDIVRKMFDDAGYDLVSTEYKNLRTALQYTCRRHSDKGVQTTTLANFLHKHPCPYCKYENGESYCKSWPDDIIVDALDKLGCDFVDKYSDGNNTVIRFICRKHPWKGVQETFWTGIRQKRQICGVCSGHNRTTSDFVKMMEEINPDIEIIGEYTGARNTIKCRCKIDGHEWEPIVYNLLSGFGCPICGSRNAGLLRRTPPEEKMERLKKAHPDIIFLNTPLLNNDIVKCKCKICGCEWETTYGNLVNPSNLTGCPGCFMSNSEKTVLGVLEKWGIKYKKQHKFDDCRDKHKLPFDFYLPDSGVLIEFDGEQHYYPVRRYKDDPDGLKAQKQFEITVRHDNIKTDYCFDHNIPLIRIPYWHRDDLEYFMFDQFVKYNVIEQL